MKKFPYFNDLMSNICAAIVRASLQWKMWKWNYSTPGSDVFRHLSFEYQGSHWGQVETRRSARSDGLEKETRFSVNSTPHSPLNQLLLRLNSSNFPWCYHTVTDYRQASLLRLTVTKIIFSRVFNIQFLLLISTYWQQNRWWEYKRSLHIPTTVWVGNRGGKFPFSTGTERFNLIESIWNIRHGLELSIPFTRENLSLKSMFSEIRGLNKIQTTVAGWWQDYLKLLNSDSMEIIDIYLRTRPRGDT